MNCKWWGKVSFLNVAMVRVRCCQTNKVYRVAVSELGRKDDLPPDDADLRKGAVLLWACGSHSYQVTVLDVTLKGTGMFLL